MYLCILCSHCPFWTVGMFYDLDRNKYCFSTSSLKEESGFSNTWRFPGGVWLFLLFSNATVCTNSFAKWNSVYSALLKCFLCTYVMLLVWKNLFLFWTYLWCLCLLFFLVLVQVWRNSAADASSVRGVAVLLVLGRYLCSPLYYFFLYIPVLLTFLYYLLCSCCCGIFPRVVSVYSLISSLLILRCSTGCALLFHSFVLF